MPYSRSDFSNHSDRSHYSKVVIFTIPEQPCCIQTNLHDAEFERKIPAISHKKILRSWKFKPLKSQTKY